MKLIKTLSYAFLTFLIIIGWKYSNAHVNPEYRYLLGYAAGAIHVISVGIVIFFFDKEDETVS